MSYHVTCGIKSRCKRDSTLLLSASDSAFCSSAQSVKTVRRENHLHLGTGYWYSKMQIHVIPHFHQAQLHHPILYLAPLPNASYSHPFLNSTPKIYQHHSFSTSTSNPFSSLLHVSIARPTSSAPEWYLTNSSASSFVVVLPMTS